MMAALQNLLQPLLVEVDRHPIRAKQKARLLIELDLDPFHLDAQICPERAVENVAARVVGRAGADWRRAGGGLRGGPLVGGAYVEELYRGLLPGMVEGLAGVGVDERRVRDVAAGYVMRHGALVAGVAGDEDAGAALEEVVAGLEREGVG